MSYLLYNGSLQYQCVFDDIESVFSSHTVRASRQDVCNRLILFFDAFKLDNLASVSICLPSILRMKFNFVHADILSFIVFILSVIILKFLYTAL